MTEEKLDGVVAIIGGTGLDWQSDSSPLQNARNEVVETRWGRALVTRATFANRAMLFLQRHAALESDASTRRAARVPPHRINYRANIAALKKCGATAIFASAAVGALRREYSPGTLLLLDDFLDWTTQRAKTFFDERAVYADMTAPYCPALRALLKQSAEECNIALHDGGVYVCTDGPRFETAAEVRALAHLGGDVVGMTGATEIVLAREANISYASIAIVTNAATGILPQPLTEIEVLDAMRESLPRVVRIFQHAAQNYRDDPTLPSRRVTEEYGFPGVWE